VILGEDITHADLVPVFDGFMKDLDEVRIGILKHLADFLRVSARLLSWKLDTDISMFIGLNRLFSLRKNTLVYYCAKLSLQYDFLSLLFKKLIVMSSNHCVRTEE